MASGTSKPQSMLRPVLSLPCKKIKGRCDHNIDKHAPKGSWNLDSWLFIPDHCEMVFQFFFQLRSQDFFLNWEGHGAEVVLRLALSDLI